MIDEKMIEVEVAYALAEKQLIKRVSLLKGATIKDAIEFSQIEDDFEITDLSEQKVGIFSKAATLDTPVRNKDRVEIYRKLIADPKEVRRAKLKAEQNKKK